MMCVRIVALLFVGYGRALIPTARTPMGKLLSIMPHLTATSKTSTTPD